MAVRCPPTTYASSQARPQRRASAMRYPCITVWSRPCSIHTWEEDDMENLANEIERLSRDLHVPFEPLADSWLPMAGELVQPELAIRLLSATPGGPEERWR